MRNLQIEKTAMEACIALLSSYYSSDEAHRLACFHNTVPLETMKELGVDDLTFLYMLYMSDELQLDDFEMMELTLSVVYNDDINEAFFIAEETMRKLTTTDDCARGMNFNLITDAVMDYHPPVNELAAMLEQVTAPLHVDRVHESLDHLFPYKRTDNPGLRSAYGQASSYERLAKKMRNGY